MSKSLKILCTILAVVAAIPAFAATITFDDLPDDGQGTPIPNGYNGFNWTNFFVVDTAQFATNTGLTSGYDVAATSPPNVAFNGFGDSALFSNTLFDLNSAYLTAVWRDDLQVQVVGSLLGATIYDNIYTLSATAPTLINFNYLGIDSVAFSIFSGGTHHEGYGFDDSQFAMDDLVVNAPRIGNGDGNGQSVPDPGTTAMLLGFSLCGLGFLRRKLT